MNSLFSKTKAASDIRENGLFFENVASPYSIFLLGVLHQNKALHNFHKRGKLPITGRIKGLD